MKCAIILTACMSLLLNATHTMAETDTSTFEQRARFYIKQVSAQDPDLMMDWGKRVWPQAGAGDPHKYVMPVIIARLAENPRDENALRAYRRITEENHAKGDRGLFHFAGYLRARMVFEFREHLPADIIKTNEYDARQFFDILTRGGTENHAYMHRTTGYLWSEYLDNLNVRGGRDGNFTRQWFFDQTQRLYHSGIGEYDSSTYYAYTSASVANIHDFGKDPVMRDVAKASLEWIATAMAIKYFHGMTLGPESRGFARHPVGAFKRTEGTARAKSGVEFDLDSAGATSDWTAWLWFGGSARPMPLDGPSVRVDEHANVVHALGGYRPHPVIRNIALKRIDMPFEARGSKPRYYGPRNDDGTFTCDNKDQEVLYFDQQFAMGTLYSPEDGVRIRGTILPQTTMFKLLVRDKADVYAFGMCNGYHGHFPLEGRNPFDQYHQKGAAAINISYVDPAMIGEAGEFVPPHREVYHTDEEYARIVEQARRTWGNTERERVREQSILGFPEAAGRPVVKDGWYFWQVNKAFVAARPLNGKADYASDEQVQHGRVRPLGYLWLRSPGPLGGWVVQAGQQPEYQSLEAFQQAVLTRCKLDLSAFDVRQRTVTFTNLAGDVLQMRHTASASNPGGRPDAWVNQEKLVFENWPIFESPYVNLDARGGVMRLTDGRQVYSIDFRGNRPAFETAVVR